jgi:hypothetical protein
MRSSCPPGRVVATLISLTAVLTACGTDRQAALPPAPPAAESSTQAPDAPTSTAEVDVDRSGMEPAVITSVRYAAHETYDRLVVELKGGVPGYNVKWVDEFVQDGSGRAIDVHGGAYLQLTLFPAHAHDDDGLTTWAGGPIYAANLDNLTNVVRTGDFEGRVGIGLVLAKRAAFQVTEQDAPNRLVLDVAH